MSQKPLPVLRSTIALAQLAVAACKAYDIKRVVISPGSRNAPLTLGFTADPFFDCYAVVDERCAAFFGLGMAQQTKQPTVLVCTSGSAVLNYYPAVAEAYYSDIPLIVLSADRPGERIDIGDGQTIQQAGVFDKHVGFSGNCISDCTAGSVNFELFNRALNKALNRQTPIHINLPFNEPLYNQTRESAIDFKKSDSNIDTKEIGLTVAQQEHWREADRIMVLAGVMHPDELDQQVLDRFLDDSRVLLLTETTSNLHHDKVICGTDQLIAALSPQEFEALQPDLLISMGGMIVSKKIKAFLRAYPPKTHWHVDPLKAYDTFFVLEHHFIGRAGDLLQILGNNLKGDIGYQQQWISQRDSRRKKHQRYLDQIPYSDLKVYDQVLKSLPESCHLQVANSAAIRYTQLFELPKSIPVFCNRGTSGIDGSTSTAIGAALINDRQTVFISGDLSFFYDSNALWNNYTPKDFRVILVNNSGGGIFRILPGDKNSENFDTYFETVHNLTAEKLCQMYGWDYAAANSESELKQELDGEFWKGDSPALLEIFTPRTSNDKLLLDYFDFVK